VGWVAAAADAAVTEPRFRYVTPVRVRRAGAIRSCLVLVLACVLAATDAAAAPRNAAPPHTEDAAVTDIVQHVVAE
jgi:hypothetical protein